MAPLSLQFDTLSGLSSRVRQVGACATPRRPQTVWQASLMEYTAPLPQGRREARCGPAHGGTCDPGLRGRGCRADGAPGVWRGCCVGPGAAQARRHRTKQLTLMDTRRRPVWCPRPCPGQYSWETGSRQALARDRQLGRGASVTSQSPGQGGSHPPGLGRWAGLGVWAGRRAWAGVCGATWGLVTAETGA